MKLFKGLMLAATIAALFPASSAAQRISLEADTKDFAARATQTVEVTLDGPLLRLASKFLATQDADAVRVGRLVNRLEGIYVRSYEFANEGEYDRAAIDRFRSRIGPGWQKIVNVSSVNAENVEIYTQVTGDVISGLFLIAAEPKELTFVNIVGPIDIEQLSALEGQFGIPRIRRD